jgi:hypothetical protein
LSFFVFVQQDLSNGAGPVVAASGSSSSAEAPMKLKRPRKEEAERGDKKEDEGPKRSILAYRIGG